MIFSKGRLGANAIGSLAIGSLIAGAVVCAVAVTVPTKAAAQSLKSELQLLIRTNPRIEEQRAILRRAQEAVTTARAGYYPTVSATGSFGGETTSNIARRNSEVDDAILKFNALGLEVRQNLYDGFATDNSVDSALMARDSVALALESTVQAVMLQGVSAYINVLRLNELIRVARARERTIREQLNLETERVERGAGIEVDVLQAKSRLQLAIEARVDLEGQLENAAADYIQAFERHPDITQMRLVATPLDLVPSTLEDALFIAREKNPLIVARTFLARSARFTVEAQRAGYMPTVDLVGRYDYEKNVSTVEDHVRKAAVLIELSWDLFSGFATRSAVASANESLLETLAGSDRTMLEIERQVRVSWTKLENTRERKELLLNAVSIAQEVFVARQKLRAAGKETTLNVLDAENEVFQAEQNLIRADYDTRVAIYELASAMGVMSPAMLGIDAQVIENIDSYFTGPEEVTIPDPIEEVEEYRARVKAIRDPNAAPAASDEAAPAPAAAAEPAPAQPTETPSVIEPPPAPQSSLPTDSGLMPASTPEVALGAAPGESGTTQRLADVLNASSDAPPISDATIINAAADVNTAPGGAATRGVSTEKPFGVALQETMVQGLPPASDPFSSAIPDTTDVSDATDVAVVETSVVETSVVETSVVETAGVETAGVETAGVETSTASVTTGAPAAVTTVAPVAAPTDPNDLISGIRQALGITDDQPDAIQTASGQTATDPVAEPAKAAEADAPDAAVSITASEAPSLPAPALPAPTLDVPYAATIVEAEPADVPEKNIADASDDIAPVIVAPKPAVDVAAPQSERLAVNADGDPATPHHSAGEAVVSSIANLFASADPAVDGTARVNVSRTSTDATSGADAMDDTGLDTAETVSNQSTPVVVNPDGDPVLPENPVGDAVVNSISDLFASADPAVDGTARVNVSRTSPAATSQANAMDDTGLGATGASLTPAAPVVANADGDPTLPEHPAGEAVVNSISDLFASADPAVDGTARVNVSRTSPAATSQADAMDDTGLNATGASLAPAAPVVANADGDPALPEHPAADAVVNSISDLFASADPAVDGTARVNVSRTSTAAASQADVMDDTGPADTTAASLTPAAPVVANADDDPALPHSTAGKKVITSIANLFASADPAVDGTARIVPEPQTNAADVNDTPVIDSPVVDPAPTASEPVVNSEPPAVTEPSVTEPSATEPRDVETATPEPVDVSAPMPTPMPEPVVEQQAVEQPASAVPVTVIVAPDAQPASGLDDDEDRDSIVVWNSNDSSAAFDIPGSLLFGGAE